ncbi:N-acetylneuraminate lyase-like [Plodia interpunctella]|uniref:N-acetylneuraminate lyase-like n=1 Tax=Plodia interpunctella TaxID=58824 RepID=UPI0023684BDC|nr:N-acetylneuraminate lyase-like [Plodia interpunctella]
MSQSSTGAKPVRLCSLAETNKTNIMVSFTVQGLVPPVFTAFNDDHSVNYNIIPSYAKFLADAGIKAVLVGGTTGEHMSLPIEDRKKLISEWVRVGKSLGIHIMVQVGGTAFPYVIELAKYCEKVGVDSLLTLPELYFKPAKVDDLVFYIEQIAKAAPKLPVLYYHIPSMSKVELDMPAFVAAASARVPNFKGIKFTHNDLSVGAQVLRTLKDGQEVFLGADTLLAPAALLGIRSSIGTTFNLFPRLAVEILQAVQSKDGEKARALQEKLCKAVEAHVVEGEWVPIMKAGMEIVTGFKMGPPAYPQRPISAEARQRIQTKLRALGLAK